MLVNGKIGEYDFSEADAIVDYAVSKEFEYEGILWFGENFLEQPIQRN